MITGDRAALPTPKPHARAVALMRQALDVAAGTPAGDVPVGAIVTAPDGTVIAAATNRREADNDPTAHAEVLALRAAAAKGVDKWRLEDCTLVVTLEPCAMCAGAAVSARVKEIIFGAWEPKTGACGSIWDIPRDPCAPYRASVRGGVLADECSAIVTGFFHNLRAACSSQ